MEELALITYPERKTDGGFRFKEKTAKGSPTSALLPLRKTGTRSG